MERKLGRESYITDLAQATTIVNEQWRHLKTDQIRTYNQKLEVEKKVKISDALLPCFLLVFVKLVLYPSISIRIPWVLGNGARSSNR